MIAAVTTATIKTYLKPRRLPRLIRSPRRCPVPHLILERADAWAESLGERSGCATLRQEGHTILRDGSGTRWRAESYRNWLQVSDAYAQRIANRVWRATATSRAVRWSWYDHPSGARGYLTHPSEA